MDRPRSWLRRIVSVSDLAIEFASLHATVSTIDTENSVTLCAFNPGVLYTAIFFFLQASKSMKFTPTPCLTLRRSFLISANFLSDLTINTSASSGQSFTPGSLGLTTLHRVQTYRMSSWWYPSVIQTLVIALSSQLVVGLLLSPACGRLTLAGARSRALSRRFSDLRNRTYAGKRSSKEPVHKSTTYTTTVAVRLGHKVL